MKYNPKINEDMAALPGFTEIHPLQPTHTVQGCLEVIKESENLLCEITGMDRMTFQPAAGAHGEFTGLLLIKAYHKSRGDEKRKKIIVPDSAHGTNPAKCGNGRIPGSQLESERRVELILKNYRKYAERIQQDLCLPIQIR